jgi:hypothetical protein
MGCDTVDAPLVLGDDIHNGEAKPFWFHGTRTHRETGRSGVLDWL